MSFAQEFKEFAMRGNVVDLAVGVVIGGAFGKIVNRGVPAGVVPRFRCLPCGRGEPTILARQVVVHRNGTGRARVDLAHPFRHDAADCCRKFIGGGLRGSLVCPN